MIINRNESAQPDVPVQSGALFGCFNVRRPEAFSFRGLEAQSHRARGQPHVVTSDVLVPHGSRSAYLPGPESAIGILPCIPDNRSAQKSHTAAIVSTNVPEPTYLCGLGMSAGATDNKKPSSVAEELCLHMQRLSSESSLPPFERALASFRGGFAFLCLTSDGIMAARDPLGIRPLVLGQLDQGIVLATETVALDQVGAEFIRNILPGEIFMANRSGIQSRTYTPPLDGPLALCFIELLHAVKPESRVYGVAVGNFHQRLGLRLAQEHPLQADLILASPARGPEAAEAYAHAVSRPLMDLSESDHELLFRLFRAPADVSADERSILQKALHGRSIAVIDPSLILNERLLHWLHALGSFGPGSLHVLSASPRIVHPNCSGIVFPESWERADRHQSEEKIRLQIQCDSLHYLSLKGLLSCCEQAQDFSTQCFTGLESTGIQCPDPDFPSWRNPLYSKV